MSRGLTATALLISRKGEVEGQPFANMTLHYITVVQRTINTAFYTYEACSKHFTDFITEHFIFYLGVNCPCYTNTPTTNRLLQMFPIPLFLQFSTQFLNACFGTAFKSLCKFYLLYGVRSSSSQGGFPFGEQKNIWRCLSGCGMTVIHTCVRKLRNNNDMWAGALSWGSIHHFASWTHLNTLPTGWAFSLIPPHYPDILHALNFKPYNILLTFWCRNYFFKF